MFDLSSFYKPVLERRRSAMDTTVTSTNNFPASPVMFRSNDNVQPEQQQRMMNNIVNNFDNNFVNNNNSNISAAINDDDKHNQLLPNNNENQPPKIPPLNLPVSPLSVAKKVYNTAMTNNNNNNSTLNNTDQLLLQEHDIRDSGVLQSLHKSSAAKERRRQKRADESSINSSSNFSVTTNTTSSFSKLSSFEKLLIDQSASQLLKAATTTDGHLDRDTLKILLSHQRKAFNKRYYEEQLKSGVLENLIEKLRTPRSAADSNHRRRHRRSSSISDDSSASVDTQYLMRYLTERQNVRADNDNRGRGSRVRRRWWGPRSESASTVLSYIDADHQQRTSSPNLQRSETIGTERVLDGLHPPLSATVARSDSIGANGFVEKQAAILHKAPPNSSFNLPKSEDVFLAPELPVAVSSYRRRRPENFYESTSLFSFAQQRQVGDVEQFFRRNRSQDDILARFDDDFRRRTSTDSDIINNKSTRNHVTARPTAPVVGDSGGGSGGGGATEVRSSVALPSVPLQQRSSTSSSNYSSARKQHSKERRPPSSKQTSSRQSSSLNGSSVNSKHTVFTDGSSARERERRPPVVYFLPLNDNDDTVETLGEEKAKEKKRQTFLERSLKRTNKIAEANEIRRQVAHKSKLLAEQVLLGKISIKEAGAVLHSLPEPPSAFPRSEMIESSRKKFQKLPEVRKQRDEMRKELEYCTNRIRAKIFMQKQQNRSLSKFDRPRRN